jgi:cephalosporin hydroxylase
MPMRLIVDTDKQQLIREADGTKVEYPLYSPEAFEALNQQWVRVGWGLRYSYTFSWMGRPIIQLPEDMVRIQETLYAVKPDVIIETGVAHGGSLVFYAGLCKLMGKGRVVGVDIEIRPHNRRAIEAHELFPLITLIEGSSVSPDIVARVKSLVRPGETVMVMLDSHHSKDHVLAELEAYAPLVTPGSYVVAMDGIMEEVVGAPRSSPDWGWNNPRRAAVEFAAKHPEFHVEDPPLRFNEGQVCSRATYWPSGYLRRADRRTACT